MADGRPRDRPASDGRLGGPWPAEKARATHARRIAGDLDGAHWSFSMVPNPAIGPVGFIGVWASEWAGEALSETGWMVLPDHQGNGYATAALRAILERARADDRWGDIHAFPGVTNGASNALCRKFGFEPLEGGEADYNGPPLPGEPLGLARGHAGPDSRRAV